MNTMLIWKPEMHLAATLPDDAQDEGVGDGGLDVQGLVVQCLQFLSTKIKNYYIFSLSV